MTRQSKLVLISSFVGLLSIGCLVGTGFAVWNFGTPEATSNVNVSVVSTPGFSVHVHAPNIYTLEAPSNDISTYGGLAFYNDAQDGSMTNDPHYVGLDDDHEKIFASIFIVIDTNAALLPFDIKMTVTLTGFIKDNVNFIYDDDGIVDEETSNEVKYSYTFKQENFEDITDLMGDEVEEGNKTFRTIEPLQLDGAFPYNDHFNDTFVNEGVLNIKAVKDAVTNEDYGTLNLKFETIDRN